MSTLLLYIFLSRQLPVTDTRNQLLITLPPVLVFLTPARVWKLVFCTNRQKALEYLYLPSKGMLQQVQSFLTLTAAIIFGYWSFGRQLNLIDIYTLIGCSFVSSIFCWILGTSVLQFLVNGFLVAMIFSPLFIMDWNVWYQFWPWPVFMALFGTILLSSLQLLKKSRDKPPDENNSKQKSN